MKKALTTGTTGQGGFYLAELLLEITCEVHGITRQFELLASTGLIILVGSTGKGFATPVTLRGYSRCQQLDSVDQETGA